MCKGLFVSNRERFVEPRIRRHRTYDTEHNRRNNDIRNQKAHVRSEPAVNAIAAV
jgi:hypothetical protein